MILPRYYYRRAWLRSFWLVASLSLGMLTALAAWLAGHSGWGAGALASGAALALPGVVLPSLASRPFRAWRGAGLVFSRFAGAYLAAVCYYVLIVPLGRMGAAPEASDGRSPGWIPRPAPDPAAYASQHLAGAGGAGPVREYAGWAAGSGRAWALALLPFLLALSFVDESERSHDVPTDTYTLY